MPIDFCFNSALDFFCIKHGTVFILCGFYTFGTGETDGPIGAYVMYKALEKIGFTPVIITDKYSEKFFNMKNLRIEIFDIKDGENDFIKLVNNFSPTAMISVERCGMNINNDYTNMKNKSIAEYTPRLDILFELAKEKNIFTIGIGDGGNEIGMGKLAEIIYEKLNIIPCKIKCDDLIISSVSNWGAYGFIAALSLLFGENLLQAPQDIHNFLKHIVDNGAVDGVSGKPTVSTDGFSFKYDNEILTALGNIVAIFSK